MGLTGWWRENHLTLFTCIGGREYNHRLVIRIFTSSSSACGARYVTTEKPWYRAEYRQLNAPCCWASSARYQTSPDKSDFLPQRAPELRTSRASAAAGSVDSGERDYLGQGKDAWRAQGAQRVTEEQRYRSWGNTLKNAIVAEVKTGHKMRPVEIIMIR